jgi:uncharacterized membrane protein YphA (DoxX/SURF4 family)
MAADPAVARGIATVQELTIPILLFLGLATRIATIPLLGMIAVIQLFVYPDAYNEHLVSHRSSRCFSMRAQAWFRSTTSWTE